MSVRSVPATCPSCGSANVKPIVYGLPDSQMYDDSTIVLGGCVIVEESPAFVCAECENAWGKRR